MTGNGLVEACVVSCPCGQPLMRRSAGAVRGQPTTTSLLAAQALRDHRVKDGCQGAEEGAIRFQVTPATGGRRDLLRVRT
jgi:hypothetical protein